MEKDSIIKCPECGAEINVNEILYDQLEGQIKKDFESKNAKRDKEYEKKLKEIQAEKEKVEKEKEQLKELVDKEVQQKVAVEKAKIEKTLRQKIEDEQADQVKELQRELQQKTEKVKELNKAKADIERLKREKDELGGQITLEKEREFTEQCNPRQYFSIKNQG